MLTPSQKGAAAEAHIAADAISLGIFVLRPMCDGGRYDLAFDVAGRLLRIQCKVARRMGEVLLVNCKTNRSTSSGHVSTSYTADEIDLVAAHDLEAGKTYIIPVSEVAGRRMVYLLLGAARNNQAARVRWAHNYELGAIAQLGERSAGSRKVGGSSPPSSIVRDSASPLNASLTPPPAPGRAPHPTVVRAGSTRASRE